MAASRQAPRNVARLLDHADRLRVVQRVGRGWIFVDRLLLEHFAGLDREPGDREAVQPP